MRLAIVGTRVLNHLSDERATRRFIRRLLRKHQPDEVISGGAPGVDTLVEEEAIKFGYSEGDGLVIFRATLFEFHGKGGYQERDLIIAKACTHMARVHCRLSKTYGSGWTAEKAEKLGKRVIQYCPCPKRK